MIYFIIAVLAIIYYTGFSGSDFIPSGNSNPVIPDLKKSDLPGSTQNLLLVIDSKFRTVIQDYINLYNCQVPAAVCLAIIYNESGYLVNSKTNEEIIGDDNRSFGVMQVSQPALSDVNSFYNLNYSMQDLKNLYANLNVGTLYANMCYLSASKSARREWLTFKKYNGGRDETDISKNSMATNYADKALLSYQFYKLYRN